MAITAVKTSFEDYLKSQLDKTCDFRIRAEMVDGHPKFYIHPMNVDGDTLDYLVSGNQLECVTNKQTG